MLVEVDMLCLAISPVPDTLLSLCRRKKHAESRGGRLLHSNIAARASAPYLILLHSVPTETGFADLPIH
jgi:hypothetical protein